MATIFPLPAPDGIYSLRFYETGTATTDYDDNQWQFVLPSNSDIQAWSHGIRIVAAAGADLTFTFDGVNTHGAVADGADVQYIDRCEAGIAIKGSGDFQIEAW